MVELLTIPRDWPAILLGRAGTADPTDLDEATRAGAFDGLRRAVRDLGPTGTIATIASSGLRGRGGSGYPTGQKWRVAATTEAPRRYVVANGYGADPAAGSDRFLMETDPFSVVEGMAIAAFAIGAAEAIIAVRSEATETIRRLEAAIAAADEAGFLGFDVLGSGHDMRISVRGVQGAYLLGEETVLL
jgi:NADH:ubiquinone oxidoreductase subunit F (NADH-binding)